MLILIVLSTFALIYIEDVPVTEPQPQPQVSCFAQLLGGFNGLPQSMWMLMLIMGINWIPWFPFFLFNTDWMGREVYGGNPLGDARYKLGVKAGSSGLMLKSIVFALMSFAVKPLGRYIGGAKRLWAAGNVVLVVCLSMTVVIAKVAEHERHTRSSVHLLDTNDRYSEAPPYDPHDDMPPLAFRRRHPFSTPSLASRLRYGFRNYFLFIMFLYKFKLETSIFSWPQIGLY